MKQVRCAIYTRKSSEEGLEQDFNSLDAQREACAAYILSQASEGWVALPDIYDDGGLSGGTLARPALQRLLGSIAEGRVDTVVVYKVDRLTRSLMDFSKLVETLDKAGTSFVSVTQSFNTTTSMGRLTLNMLLSFAQFEREVTAERIRDKLAASKAKGMWMGGVPPVGYKPNGRTLTIEHDEATIVRGIFERYLALGNVRAVHDALASDGVLTPIRNSTKGGGRRFSRGQIYTILNNPIYLGLIRHKDKTYPGLHDAIIEQDVWDRTQAMLADNLQGRRTRVRHPHRSLLAGKVVGDNGQPLTPAHATKGSVRYRYYVSADTSAGSTMRIPARQLETAVIARVAAALADPITMAGACGIELGSTDWQMLFGAGGEQPQTDRAAIVELDLNPQLLLRKR
jgi:site-specific DNA recombinase